MKRSENVRKRTLLFGAAFGLTFVALPTFAEDGAAPATTPGEPVNPWQAPAPSGTATPPASPPSASTPPNENPPEPAKDPDATLETTPPTPSPALAFLQSRREATASDGQRLDREALEPDDGKLRYHQDHFIGLLGLRVARITSPGFDPFADSDELAQVSLGLGRTAVTAGNFSIAGLALYDGGGRSATARGPESELTIHRLTLGVEGRYHFIRQYFVFVRGAPGALYSIARLEDDSVGVKTRAARNWVFAMDLSAGASFELSGWLGNSRARQPSVWITFEGGYGFAGESELELSAYGGQGPQRGEPVDLGPIGLGGPFMRGGVVLTF